MRILLDSALFVVIAFGAFVLVWGVIVWRWYSRAYKFIVENNRTQGIDAPYYVKLWSDFWK